MYSACPNFRVQKAHKKTPRILLELAYVGPTTHPRACSGYDEEAASRKRLLYGPQVGLLAF